MIITAITTQQKNSNRVNVMVDGKYKFSLDIFQVGDLGIRVGKEYTNEELLGLETESQFGKVYGRALEYCLMRPHSTKEVRDYLYRKTLQSRTKDGAIKQGVSSNITTRVYDRLVDKGYVDDEKFTRFWVENRNLTKGVSRRKLQAELRSKGVAYEIIERQFQDSERQDKTELDKVIAKKKSHYSDEQKFIAYLARQGFSYDDIKSALSSDHED